MQIDSVAPPERKIFVEWLAWGSVLVLAAILLVVVNVRAADSDSGLHIRFVERLNNLPMSRWIALEWGGLWGFEGLYREHPIGILIPVSYTHLTLPTSDLV